MSLLNPTWKNLQDAKNAWQQYVRELKSGSFSLIHPTLTGEWEKDKDDYITYWCELPNMNPSSSPITPEHYGGSDDPYEAIKVIQAWELGFPLGNVLKYIRRSGKKENTTALQDLLKAKKYLDYEIEKLEQCKKL